MEASDIKYILIILLLMFGFLAGISYAGSKVKKETATVTGMAILSANAGESTLIPCGQHCLGQGCMKGNSVYLGYNIDVCKCQSCSLSSDKTFYCHKDRTTQGGEECAWQKA